MSVFNGNKKYWALGACAGVLVLAGGLCAILLGGANAQHAQSLPKDGNAAPAGTASQQGMNIVVGTPEADLIAEQHKREIEAVVVRSSMLPGTSIYGVNVGGMSREEAKAAVEEQLAKEPLTVKLILSDGTNEYPASGENIEQLTATASPTPEEEEDDDAIDPELRAAEAAAAPQEEDDDEPDTEPVEEGPVGIRLTVDVDGAVGTAFSLMRDSSIPYDDFMAQVKQIAEGKDIAPAPAYDTDSVNQFVAYLAKMLDTAAVNATIGLENNVITYKDEIPGHGIDQAALTETILEADPLSGETIAIPMRDLEPAVTRQMLEGQYTLRGQYKTSFASSTSNRKYNIRFGAEKINGTVLKPGEVFSTNDTLGKRTRKNGWKTAGAYEGGEVVQQAGGGVCQLSSTLYNAVIYADLKIVERRNHSMTVSYIDPGRDATINSVGNIIDFKFANNTSSDIIIVAYTVGNNLYMEIYGVPYETDEYDEIRIRTKKAKTVGITTEETKDNTKPTSYKVTTYKGKTGYTYRTFKDYYKNGTRVNTEELGNSVYRMFPKKVTVGTIKEDADPGSSGSGSSSSSSSSSSSGGSDPGDSGSTGNTGSGGDPGSSSSSSSSGDSGSSGSSSGSGSGGSGSGGDSGSSSSSSSSSSGGDSGGSGSGGSSSGGESGGSGSSGESGSGGD